MVRLPTIVPSYPDYDLHLQAAVHRVLADGGLRVPVPVTVVDDPTFVGSPFLVMPFVEGHVLGDAPPFDPWLRALSPTEQAAVHRRFIDSIAAVHRIDWRGSAVAAVARGHDATLADEVAWWRAYVDWSSDGQPLGPLVTALEWCAAQCPVNEPAPSLLWGDPRLGNVIVGPDGDLRALLDWELATIGPGEMDLAWYLVLDDALTTMVHRRVPGFPDRDATVDRYQEQLGRAVEDLAWHEVFALTRAFAVSDRHRRLAEAAGRARPGADDLLLASLRRRIESAGG